MMSLGKVRPSARHCDASDRQVQMPRIGSGREGQTYQFQRNLAGPAGNRSDNDEPAEAGMKDL
jgi:hypothetical protein